MNNILPVSVECYLFEWCCKNEKLKLAFFLWAFYSQRRLNSQIIRKLLSTTTKVLLNLQ